MSQYEPRRAAATQDTYPWRAALRTGLWVLMAFWLAFPGIVAIVNEELAGQLPDQWEAWLATAGTTVAAVTVAVNRIMLLPAVSGLVDRLGVGPAPKN